MADSHSLGQKGEELAADHLKEKGYRILHRNWVSGKKELDIVAENKDYVVFVEVKTRSGDFSSDVRDLVPVTKQKAMLFAADTYIKRYNINKESRFDIVIIISKGNSVEINHIEEAFYPTLR